QKLLQNTAGILDGNINTNINTVYYSEAIENSINRLSSFIADIFEKKINPRPIAVRLLSSDVSFADSIKGFYKLSDDQITVLENKINDEKLYLSENDIYETTLKDYITDKIIHTSEEICKKAVSYHTIQNDLRDRRIDRIITGRLSGFPIMLAMLAVIFWLTIYGANYPSQLIAKFLFNIGEHLAFFLQQNSVNEIIIDVGINGIYRVLAWVVSVMLPPMAIFFPLFTLLEDLGYLPRVAFNLDRCFKGCSACGKQSLTMCMGFGCNAAGVIGCRIIDSPRERLIAILTNNFVPCNGRFPAIISMITMFFIIGVILPFQSVFAAIILTAFIIFSIFITLGVSWLLSATVLRGIPSSFTLELPPYRCPKVGQVLIRSLIDRTLFVLGRAIMVAAPAGLIIWLMANITAGELTLLEHVSGFLDPIAKAIGLDGVILTAFILGFPANEIVIPIIIMAYTAQGSLTDISSLDALRQLFISNGWTVITALCFILFSLMHWPCSTTLITIYRETKSIKWTATAFFIPVFIGIIICFAVSNTLRFLI
ncbi:MAG: nucleoside recognition domain-containing protein, partial [Eubacteriales bacterium]